MVTLAAARKAGFRPSGSSCDRAGCWLKTAFFVGEEMVQLRDATRRNLLITCFMRLMLVNMFRSFCRSGSIYYCSALGSIRAASPSHEALTGPKWSSSAVYFSTLQLHILRIWGHYPTDGGSQAAGDDGDYAGLPDGDLPAVGLHQPRVVAAERREVDPNQPHALQVAPVRRVSDSPRRRGGTEKAARVEPTRFQDLVRRSRRDDPQIDAD